MTPQAFRVLLRHSAPINYKIAAYYKMSYGRPLVKTLDEYYNWLGLKENGKGSDKR